MEKRNTNVNGRAHLQSGEKADIHESVHILQVLIDVESSDEGCRQKEKALIQCIKATDVAISFSQSK